jgi:hypothetical protein
MGVQQVRLLITQTLLLRAFALHLGPRGSHGKIPQAAARGGQWRRVIGQLLIVL